MKAGTTASIMRLIRSESFPTPFCPGCGHGILMGAILRAIDELISAPENSERQLGTSDTTRWSMENMVFVSGIGCGGWIPSPHFAADTLHVTHGRPVAFATGVKLYNPQLNVVVIGGDGDIASIGGNHLIHGARRNLDMTVICANNGIYGMTGGQVTPTTPKGARTVTTPAGNPDRPFDLSRLVAAAGASYVARYSVFHVRQLIRAIKTALTHPGFAFVEAISGCPVQYGRRNAIDTPVEMLRYYQDHCISIARARVLPPEELTDKIVVGEFVC
jgi:2-oxoglutarate/2-oxoacid ferredoxin oxidoreductase subunit beta